MNEIDQMDILGYLKLMAWKANKKIKPKKNYIDNVWPGMKANI